MCYVKKEDFLKIPNRSLGTEVIGDWSLKTMVISENNGDQPLIIEDN